MMHSLVVRLVLAARHYLRVAVVASFVVSFVAFATESRPDWFGVALGVVLGLLFGVVFAFGGELADALEE
jgi:hypothetical protein